MNSAFIAIVEHARARPHASGDRRMSASSFGRRFVALLRKETRQLLRDRSNLAVGLLLPVVLILLFGYGLSFDVNDAPVAVVLEDRSPQAQDVLAGLAGLALPLARLGRRHAGRRGAHARGRGRAASFACRSISRGSWRGGHARDPAAGQRRRHEYGGDDRARM